jgi:predicted dinucleotide-binding enzyme
MSYSELSQDDVVLLAIKFVAVGGEVPSEIVTILGEDLIAEISNPTGETDDDQINK